MNERKKDQIFQSLKSRESLLLLCIIGLGILAGFVTESFFQWANIVNIFNNNAIYGVLGIGMTLIMATGNIDISVGAQFAVVGICVAKFSIFLNDQGIENPTLLVLLAIAIGMMVALGNAILILVLKLPAVIVTLGTLSVIRGILYLITEGAWITYLPRWYIDVPNINFHGVKVIVVIWICLLVLFSIIFRCFKIGRMILAVGNNSEFAERIGIKIPQILVLSFVIWGALIGISAFIFVAQIGTIQPSAGNGYEMTLIASVIIGGNRISGGVCNVVGTSAGILLLGVIGNILVLAQVPMYWQNMLTGIVIISAIIISMLADKKGQEKR